MELVIHLVTYQNHDNCIVTDVLLLADKERMQ